MCRTANNPLYINTRSVVLHLNVPLMSEIRGCETESASLSFIEMLALKFEGSTASQRSVAVLPVCTHVLGYGQQIESVGLKLSMLEYQNIFKYRNAFVYTAVILKIASYQKYLWHIRSFGSFLNSRNQVIGCHYRDILCSNITGAFERIHRGRKVDLASQTCRPLNNS